MLLNDGMKTIAEIRRDRLEDLVQETKSKSLEEVAERAGTSSAYLSQIRNKLPDSKTGKPKKMGDATAEKLRLAFNKPLGWMDADRMEAYEAADVSINYEVNQTIKTYRDQTTITKFDEVGGSMGKGILLQDQPGQITNFTVTNEWINKNVPANTGKENLRIVTGFGDSMKGLFNPGDPLLVDVGVTVCDHDGVFFFKVDGEGFIKRLQRIPGQGIMVISKNPDYQTWTITKDMDFQVLAKVLKAWQSEKF
jgi:transcriptional regulator with XRE-family HTH domain